MLFNNTDYLNRINSRKISENDRIQLLITSCSELGYVFLPKDKILFHQGDKGDKVYILFQGTLSILMPKLNEITITGEEYLNILIKFLKQGKSDLLKRTIQENYRVIPIISKDIDNLEEIYFLIQLEKYYDNCKKIDKLKEFIEKSGRHFENIFKFNYKLFENLNPCDSDKQTNYLVNIMIKELQLKYPYYIDGKQFNLVIFEHEEFFRIAQGKTIGDYSIENKNCMRTATVQALEDSHLGVFTFDQYKKIMYEVGQSTHSPEINFFLEISFFHHFKSNYFHQKLFPSFTLHNISKGDYLFRQDEKLQFIYFLKEGEFELSFIYDLEGINLLLNKINSLIDSNVEPNNNKTNRKNCKSKRKYRVIQL